jgi:hypothetical protein
MTDERRAPLRRISILRTAMFLGVVLLAFLAFDPFFGIFRYLFRGILFLGVLAFAVSYLWPFIVRLVRLRRAHRR